MGKIIVVKKKIKNCSNKNTKEGFDLASTPAANASGGKRKSASSFLNELDSNLNSLEKEAKEDCPNKDDPPTKDKPKTGAKDGTGPNKKVISISEEYYIDHLFIDDSNKLKNDEFNKLATESLELNDA